MSVAPAASPDAPATLVERYYQAVARADDTALNRLVDPGAAFLAGGARRDLGAYLSMLGEYRRGFPDLTIHVAHVLEHGSWIAARTVTSAVHSGTFLGHAATFRSFSSTGADFFRIEGGRILQVDSHFDVIGMLAQLGLYEAGRR